MGPRDIVAIILALGVIIILLAGTSVRYLYLPEDTPNTDPEIIANWKDIINVIIGALAGYIAGKTQT